MDGGVSGGMGGAFLGGFSLIGAGGLGAQLDPFALLVGGLLGFGAAWWLAALWPARSSGAWGRRGEQERRRIMQEIAGIESLLRLERDRLAVDPSFPWAAGQAAAGEGTPARAGGDPLPALLPIRMVKRGDREEERRAA